MTPETAQALLHWGLWVSFGVCMAALLTLGGAALAAALHAGRCDLED